MLTGRRRRGREHGQVLILALAFIAAFALIVAAVLSFASATALQRERTQTTAQTDAAGEGGAAFAAADAARNPSLSWCPNGQNTVAGADNGTLTMADGTQAHYNLASCDPGETATSVAQQGHCLLCILNQTAFGSTAPHTAATVVFSAKCAQANSYCLVTTGGDDYFNGSVGQTSNNGQQLQACSASGQCPGQATLGLLNLGPGGATYPSGCCSPGPSAFNSPVTDPLSSIGDPVAAGIPLLSGCTTWQTCKPLNCQAAPAAPTVTPTPAGGRTTYSYAVVAFNATGDLPQSPDGSTSTGPRNLDATHFNTVHWGAMGGTATGVKVIRTGGGGSQGLIATINSPVAGSVNDDGTVTPQPYAATLQGGWSPTLGCSVNPSGNQAVSYQLYGGVWNAISVSGQASVILQPGVYVLTGTFQNTGGGIVCAPGTISAGVCTPSSGVTLYLGCPGNGATVSGQQVAYTACAAAGGSGGNISLSGGGHAANQVNLNSTPCPAGQQVPNCPGYDGVALLTDPHLVDPNTGSCLNGSPGQCVLSVSGGAGAINGSIDTRSAGIVIAGGGGDAITAGFLITNSLSIQVTGSGGTGMSLSGPGSFVPVGTACSVLVLNVYTGPSPSPLPTAVIQTQCGTAKQSGVVYFNYSP